jgi:small conductance mechanosensitive channel
MGLNTVFFAKGNELILTIGSKLIGAIALWIIGGILIEYLVNGFDVKKNDTSLKSFFKGTVAVLLKVMLALSILEMLGIEMTSFIAILGAAGSALGMALSGTLQNLTSALVLLVFKLFKYEYLIEAQDNAGIVAEIQLSNTILKTADNKTIVLPNGALSNGSMINSSIEEIRRVDWLFGLAYGVDITKAKEVNEAHDKQAKNP